MNRFQKVFVALTSILCLVGLTAASLSYQELLKSCKITSRTIDDGFVQYQKHKYIGCKNVTPTTFYDVTCDKRCKNPVTGEVLSSTYYKPKAINRIQKFVTRDNEVVLHRLRSTCRCVATSAGKQLRAQSRR